MISNPSRPDKRLDLTRWNRAGLARFDYVDGDAAIWLEELRIAAIGLSARGADFTERLPETWRDRFMADQEQWPDAAEQALFYDALVWKTLFSTFPDQPETAGKRNVRLLAQYAESRGEYAWEIMRAFARATHVLLGHHSAYANEGYLRTATQWDNIRKLAAMVNHQPAPPSSAITTVGLIVDQREEAAEVAAGLAMKYTPQQGGAQVIFETLSPIKTHFELNAARAEVIGESWNVDPAPVNFTADVWLVDEGVALAPGGLGVLSLPGGGGVPAPVTLVDVQPLASEQLIELELSATTGTWSRGSTELHITPKESRRALPRSTTGTLVVKIDTAANYSIGSIIRLHEGSDKHFMEVTGNADGHLKLKTDEVIDGPQVTIETLVPFADNGLGSVVTPSSITQLILLDASGGPNVAIRNGVPKNAVSGDGDELDELIGTLFTDFIGTIGIPYAVVDGAKRESAIVVKVPPTIIANNHHADRIVSFAGKPPKGLATGDLFVMQPGAGATAQTALSVIGVKLGSDDYSLQFHTAVSGNITTFEPDSREFHGPMTQCIRPEDFDRNPHAAFDGASAYLAGLSTAAQELIRPGRPCLIEDERDDGFAPVLAEVLDSFEHSASLFKVVFTSSAGLAYFQQGWSVLNFNAVIASHGETKSPKTLGSGDGERARQRFNFGAKRVSFIPSSVAETGVAPDMDVVVDGEIWPYRDLIDAGAEGTQSWSSSLNEDDSLNIHFRRRLPTGSNNVSVRRHRVGVGAAGSVPARAFIKPMKKNRHVTTITQPFAASGGAEREPIDDIRVNAPARLAANGRAVSLEDFARLCRRRSDVWQARAQAITNPTSPHDVAITIVAANGAVVGDTLHSELVEFVESKALPGVRVAILDFGAVHLRLDTTIYVDTEKFDKSEVQQASHAALVAGFSLSARALGQPVYIAEVVAALEGVSGVSTATVHTFALKTGAPPILREARVAGSVSALFPTPVQVISVAANTSSADFTVAVEVIG